MNYGNWELRDDSSYYFSSTSQIYPSSNATDSGKLNTEENVRNIYRDVLDRNFVTNYKYFKLTPNASRDGVIVSHGEAVINGYHFRTTQSIEIDLPNDSVTDQDNGNNIIIPYTLAIAVSYDGANNVTGDVVVNDNNNDSNEILSGIYLKWYDEYELEDNYDKLLVLGRAWVCNGRLIPNGTSVKDDMSGKERIVYRALEQDPFKNHKLDASSIEVKVRGHKWCKYDTLYDNMSSINNDKFSYDSVHYPIDTDRQQLTKMPSFVTDIQDVVSYLPDWFISKYGDYVSGAIRLNNKSIDSINEFGNVENDGEKIDVVKDAISSVYNDSGIISPRTYGNLTVHNNDSANRSESYDYDTGATIMSIVPSSYNDDLDVNNGYVGNHVAMVSQKYGETGIRIHNGDNLNGVIGTTRLVHCTNSDDIKNRYYHTIEKTDDNLNSSNFIIENIGSGNTIEDAKKSSILFKNGFISIDSDDGVQLFSSNGNVNGFAYSFQPNKFDIYYTPSINHKIKVTDSTANTSTCFSVSNDFGIPKMNVGNLALQSYAIMSGGEDEYPIGYVNSITSAENNEYVYTTIKQLYSQDTIIKDKLLIGNVEDSNYLYLKDGYSYSLNTDRVEFDVNNENHTSTIKQIHPFSMGTNLRSLYVISHLDGNTPYGERSSYINGLCTNGSFGISDKVYAENDFEMYTNDNNWCRISLDGMEIHNNEVNTSDDDIGYIARVNSKTYDNGVFVGYNTKDDMSLIVGGNTTFINDVHINGALVTSQNRNDLAELYVKNNRNNDTTYGDVISVSEIDDKQFEICNTEYDKKVVGVTSNSYGMLLGGDANVEKYYTVALTGKVPVKVIDNSGIHIGDLLTSATNGKAQKLINAKQKITTQSSIVVDGEEKKINISFDVDMPMTGCVIGKALSEPYVDVENNNATMVLMQVMLS